MHAAQVLVFLIHPSYTWALTHLYVLGCAFSAFAPQVITSATKPAVQIVWSLSPSFLSPMMHVCLFLPNEPPVILGVVSTWSKSCLDCLLASAVLLFVNLTYHSLYSPPGNMMKVLRGHPNWVYSCAFSPDSSILCSVGASKTVSIKVSCSLSGIWLWAESFGILK